MSDERKAKALEAALESLVEYFDTVQIFVTKHGGSDETTSSTSVGRGNIFARLEQARLWLETQEADLIDTMMRGQNPPPQEGDEGAQDEDK